MVILGGNNVNGDRLSDGEVLDMQTEDKGCDPTDLPSPVSGHASVYSSTLQSLITCGGIGNIGRKIGFLSSCSVQNNNGHQKSIPPMKSTRAFSAMVSIRNQLISLVFVMK